MPQPGLHAIIALAARGKLPKQPMLATGVVLGSMAPDLDGYAQAVATLGFHVDPHAAEAMFHRTLTHSLLFALLAGSIVWVIGQVQRSEAIGGLGVGLALGIAIFHSLIDIFAWFDGVGILWPFASVNLWSSVHLSDTVANLLRAGNFLAFGLFLMYLERIAGQAKLSLYARSLLILSLTMAVLAVQLTPKIYSLLDGTLLLLYAFPVVLWTTWRMRHVIEGNHAR